MRWIWLAGLVMTSGIVLAGCAPPSPVDLEIFREPQASPDVLPREALPVVVDLDQGSTRFLAEAGGMSYFARGAGRTEGTVCLVMAKTADAAQVRSGCSTGLPIELGTGTTTAKLLTDGFADAEPEGGWRLLSPNLLIKD